MTTSSPAWLAEYGGPPATIDRFRSFVSDKAVACVYDAWRQVRSERVPFHRWRWQSAPSSSPGKDTVEWLVLYQQLLGYLLNGGVLVIIGPARAGKSRLLEDLVPGRIIDNFRSGLNRNAPVSLDDVPLGVFAIDETQAHDRNDVVRVIIEMRYKNRGFVLVFQRPESFREHEISAHLAMEPVLFLELADQSATV